MPFGWKKACTRDLTPREKYCSPLIDPSLYGVFALLDRFYQVVGHISSGKRRSSWPIMRRNAYGWNVIRDDTCQPIGSFNRIAPFHRRFLASPSLGTLFFIPSLTRSKSFRERQKERFGEDSILMGEKVFLSFSKGKWTLFFPFFRRFFCASGIHIYIYLFHVPSISVTELYGSPAHPPR